MARQRRLFIAGLSQHVIQRGNNRSDIFRSTADYETCLAALYDAAVRFEMDVHGYVLMTTHFHLLVTPRRPRAVAKAMHSLNHRYATYVNQKYERTGGVFEGRYRSTLIDTERYWLSCLRYVELNPVRAGIVAQPDTYKWSSYSAHALGAPDRIVTDHWLFAQLAATSEERQQCWRTICAEPIPEEELVELQRAVHRGGALGPLALPCSV